MHTLFRGKLGKISKYLKISDRNKLSYPSSIMLIHGIIIIIIATIY